jgi:hypothetical protein
METGAQTCGAVKWDLIVMISENAQAQCKLNRFNCLAPTATAAVAVPVKPD